MSHGEKSPFYYKPWTLERMRGVVVYTLGQSSVKPMKNFLWKDLKYHLSVRFFLKENFFSSLLL
jgi:hypothetical protein